MRLWSCSSHPRAIPVRRYPRREPCPLTTRHCASTTRHRRECPLAKRLRSGICPIVSRVLRFCHEMNNFKRASRCRGRSGESPTRAWAVSSMAVRDLWYKNAILYCLDVEKYMDANGDGTGDFEGLHRRLEYLAGLGVTCLWLQPFYPSPNRDNGYDISDFYGVHPKHGSPGDFVEFMNHAKALGLRVIVDLV